jgi:Zn-dependent protease
MLDINLATIISRLITIVIAFTFHEMAHAASAYLFGDKTAANQGRITLNPIAHIDPIGALMILFAGFGWAKPTPVDEYTLRRRSPFAIAIVSVAGPISNLILAAIAAIPFRLSLLSFYGFTSKFFPTISEFLIEFIIINIGLFLFNLLPVFPLDGEKILYSFAPPELARLMDRIRPYGSLILMGLIMLGRLGKFDILGIILDKPLLSIFRLLLGV